MSDFVKGFELYEIKDEKETAEKIFNSLTDKAKKILGLDCVMNTLIEVKASN